jgi:hypothetical protein
VKPAVQDRGVTRDLETGNDSSGFTDEGPLHEEVAAFVRGASNIRRTKAPASLLRSVDM